MINWSIRIHIKSKRISKLPFIEPLVLVRLICSVTTLIGPISSLLNMEEPENLPERCCGVMYPQKQGVKEKKPSASKLLVAG